MLGSFGSVGLVLRVVCSSQWSRTLSSAGSSDSIACLARIVSLNLHRSCMSSHLWSVLELLRIVRALVQCGVTFGSSTLCGLVPSETYLLVVLVVVLSGFLLIRAMVLQPTALSSTWAFEALLTRRYGGLCWTCFGERLHCYFVAREAFSAVEELGSHVQRIQPHGVECAACICMDMHIMCADVPPHALAHRYSRSICKEAGGYKRHEPGQQTTRGIG